MQGMHTLHSNTTNHRNIVTRLAGIVIALVAAVAMVVPTMLLAVPSAAAQEISKNIITSASVNPDTVQPLGTATLTMEFQLPNNTIHAGDTSTITLPANFTYFNSGTDFDIHSDEGAVVAHAHIAGSTMTLTYTEYVERHSDISGTITAAFTVQNSATPGEQEFHVTVSGTPVPISNNGGKITVEPGDPEANTVFGKYGYQSGDSTDELLYMLRVNVPNQNLSNITIEDQLTSAGLSYLPSTFTVTQGTWVKDAQGKYSLQNATDVTSRYQATITTGSDGIQHFSMNIGDLNGVGLLVQYYVRASADIPAGTSITNNATMNYNNGDTAPSGSTTVWKLATGHAHGYIYAINITKTDASTGEKLQGAEFTVTRTRTGQVVGTVTTDANGNATLGNLVRDDYVISETKAPAGYTKAASVTVSASDFKKGNDSTTYSVTIQDNKATTPEKPSQPETQKPTTVPQAPSSQPKQPAPAKTVSTPLSRTGGNILIFIVVAVVLLAIGAGLFAYSKYLKRKQ